MAKKTQVGGIHRGIYRQRRLLQKLAAQVVSKLSMPPALVLNKELDLCLDLPRSVKYSEIAKITGTVTPRHNPVMDKLALLVKTDKMSCFSWNLPAGPSQQRMQGTCAASAFWEASTTGNLRASQAAVAMVENMTGQSFAGMPDKERREAVSAALRDARGDAICQGCYALSGNYDYPNVILQGEIKRQWVNKLLAKNPQIFVDTMVTVIRHAQALSVRRIERGFTKRLRDPNYFRIHDAGDFMREDYVDAWLAVVRKCAKTARVPSPLALDKGKLVSVPAIKFWAPSRAWVVDERLLGDAFWKRRKMPKNLVVRPSSLYLHQPAPELTGTGFSAGSAVTILGREFTKEDIAAAESVVGKLAHKKGGKGFICAAYLVPSIGGGAKPGDRDPWVNGSCADSRGIGTKRFREGGPGCRVCWENPDVAVVYALH